MKRNKVLGARIIRYIYIDTPHWRLGIAGSELIQVGEERRDSGNM
jgi:hypothetical protein